jgi:hypothetical protein
MTADLFSAMQTCAVDIITGQLGLKCENICLVSGGAAGADHVAVRLFLQGRANNEESKQPSFAGLELFLPCKVDVKTGIAQEKDSHQGCGQRMNELHRAFSDLVGLKSPADLVLAAKSGAVFNCGSVGFLARNTKIAKTVQYLIAFTFGKERNAPKEGGTADTWRKALFAKKIHVPLNELAMGTLVGEGLRAGTALGTALGTFTLNVQAKSTSQATKKRPLTTPVDDLTAKRLRPNDQTVKNTTSQSSQSIDSSERKREDDLERPS